MQSQFAKYEKQRDDTYAIHSPALIVAGEVACVWFIRRETIVWIHLCSSREVTWKIPPVCNI